MVEGLQCLQVVYEDVAVSGVVGDGVAVARQYLKARARGQAEHVEEVIELVVVQIEKLEVGKLGPEVRLLSE